MRLFIAVQLSDSMRQAVVQTQEMLMRQGVRGNYTPEENLHLTLAYIGEYTDPDLVLDTLGGIPFEPLELALKGVGAFGDLWWMGLEPSRAFHGYVRQLRHGLAEAGIPFDRKRFAPHITLLRRASVDLSKVRDLSVERAVMIADHASLMRSDRGKRGMIYTEII